MLFSNNASIIRERLRTSQEKSLTFRNRSRIIFDVANKETKTSTTKKDPAAVALGRKGGLKGGHARAANMSPEERSESARKAVLARWAKAKAQAE